MKPRLLVQFSDCGRVGGYDMTPRGYCFILIDDKEKRHSIVHKGQTWISIERARQKQHYLVPGRLEFIYG